jgi:hypothetical protein
VKARVLRLYKVQPKLMGICLFEINDGAVGVVSLLQPDPLAAVLDGADEVVKLKSLRDAVESGGYVITNHDPDDWPFREAELVSLDDLLKKLES